MPRYDAIVIGLGGMGSAAAYHLAQAGKRVLGLERFAIPHELGSSHGLSRIIRLAYFEHPSYVPLLRRSYQLWRDLEGRAGERLLHITGCVEAGLPGSRVFEGALVASHEHGLPHELFTARELARHYPGFALPDEMMALVEPEGGFLVPEACVAAHPRLAAASGAELHTAERVVGWEPHAGGVRVRTDRAEYAAERLVITAGPWAPALVPELRPLAVPERQVIGWFEPLDRHQFTLGDFPVFIVEDAAAGGSIYYGFPAHGSQGLKLGCFHHLRETADPDALDRLVTPRDEAVLRDFLLRYLPQAAGPAQAFGVCMFTNTPDEHFIIDRHPKCSQVVIGAGFSGHGFKFCSVVGEILADLALDRPVPDISLFALNRF